MYKLVVLSRTRLLIPPVSTDDVVVAKHATDTGSNTVNGAPEREDSLWSFTVRFMLMQCQSSNTQIGSYPLFPASPARPNSAIRRQDATIVLRSGRGDNDYLLRRDRKRL